MAGGLMASIHPAAELCEQHMPRQLHCLKCHWPGYIYAFIIQVNPNRKIYRAHISMTVHNWPNRVSMCVHACGT